MVRKYFYLKKTVVASSIFCTKRTARMILRLYNTLTSQSKFKRVTSNVFPVELHFNTHNTVYANISET